MSRLALVARVSGEGDRLVGRPATPSPRALDARGLGTFHQLVVQLADAGDRPRFAESCRAFGDLVWCRDADDAGWRAIQPEVTALVVDLCDSGGTDTTEIVAKVRHRRPDLPIILWCDRRQATEVPLTRWLAAGISAVVLREETDLESRLLSAISRASDLAFRQLTDQAIHRRIPTALAPVVRHCLDHAHGVARVDTVAEAVGLTPRALAYQLRRAGLPPVSTLVMWGKALVAAYRLERSTEPIAGIARSLGFATGSALRRLLKRCANETPQGLRQPGGFGWVLRCFERQLSKAVRR
ncbi:MAG: helix-turn-helix transcriptional regulator [Gemmatimonadetes bacterium]|nr:helix-turn-helix transcriptional regulator [Gemmatimonadota bacterium]